MTDQGSLAPARQQLNSRYDAYRPTTEATARILLLVSRFSQGSNVLEGRTKLAKLDYFLRYPERLAQVLAQAGVDQDAIEAATEDRAPIEEKMVRYRYGPWDPAYFAILGNLIGKRLIEVVPRSGRRGNGYRITSQGSAVVDAIAADEAWAETVDRLRLLHRHLNLSGERLKNLVYSSFQDVAEEQWGEDLI